MLIVRTVYSDISLEKRDVFSATCRRGLLPPQEIRIIYEKYSVRNTCLYAQVNGEDLQCVKEGATLFFERNPFRDKICPGTVTLELKETSGDLFEVRTERKGCLEIPPKGYVFCKKHFNTYYGQYIRFVFGSGKPNPRNPFFKVPAFLYSVYYGGEILKVGTTIVFKGMRRMLEQPILLTSLLYIAENIEEARGMEIFISHSKPFSQAPRSALRISNVFNAIEKDFQVLPRKFACLLNNSLRNLRKTNAPRGIEKIILNIESKGIPIQSLAGDVDKLLQQAIPVENLDQANNVLEGKECLFSGIAKGFVILKCGKELYAVPFELFRDRRVEVNIT